MSEYTQLQRKPTVGGDAPVDTAVMAPTAVQSSGTSTLQLPDAAPRLPDASTPDVEQEPQLAAQPLLGYDFGTLRLAGPTGFATSSGDEPPPGDALPPPPPPSLPRSRSAEPLRRSPTAAPPNYFGHEFGRVALQPKLSVSQPHDPYEQEADRVAAQVMRMPEPGRSTESASVAGHDFSQVALRPLAQRKCAACEAEEEETLMRKANGESSNEMGHLETQLAANQGQGEPLADDVRAFMESRFGFDFSQVRLHTDSTAAEMSQAIGAQAFTHGNDIYFNAGRYDPATRSGQELLAHELTHTIQQTGGNSPLASSQKAESSKTEVAAIDQSSMQNSLMLWRMVQTKANLHPMGDQRGNQATQIEGISERNPASCTPDIQAKCSQCEEETIQRRTQQQTVTPIASRDETIQRNLNPLEAAVDGGRWLRDRGEHAVELVGEGVEELGDWVEDIANWTGDQIADLVAQVAPELAEFIRNNPIETIKTKVEEGIQSWLDGLFAGFDISGAINNFTGRFDELFEIVRAFLSEDPESCAAVAEKLNSMTEFVRGVMDSPAIQAMQDAITKISDIFQKVVDGFVAPIFDRIMDIAGGALSAVVDFAQDIWRWTEPVRRFIGGALQRAWTWVKEQLGFGGGEGDSEGGIVNWVKEKASEAWNFIKEKFGPIVEPLQKVLLVVVAISPVGWIAGAIKYGPQLIEMAKWLWNNRDNPDIVQSAHEEMGHTILPQLLSNLQGFGDGIQNAVNSLIGTVTEFSQNLINVLGSMVNVPLLSMAQGLVQTVSDRIQAFVTWSQETFQSMVQSIVRFAKSVKEKIEPYISVLSSLGMALLNPASIPLVIAGAAWRLLPECYKGPIINFLLDTLIEILSGMPDFPFFGLLWPLLKTGVLGFLRGLRAQSTEVKVAISNKIAKIISGGSPDFMLGFVKGLLKGIWEGLADPFLLIYDGITAINDFQEWLTRSDTEARNPSGNSAEPDSDEEGDSTHSQPPDRTQADGRTDDDADASRRTDSTPDRADTADDRAGRGRSGFVQEVAQEASQNVLEVIVDRLLSMATELQPPTEEVTGNFMGAMQEVLQGAGEKITFEDFVQRLGEIKQAIMNAIEDAGVQLANQVCEFMMQDEAEGKIGEGAGYLAGTIIFEVVLAIFTAGGGTAAKAVIRVARQITRVLDRQGDAMRMVSRSMKTLGKHLDDILASLRNMLSQAGGKAGAVMDRLGFIGDLLRRYSDELLELLTGGVPIPGGRRDRDSDTPDPRRAPERDAEGAPHRDGDDAQDRDSTPQPDRSDAPEGQQPDRENTPVAEPNPQRPRDREDASNPAPDGSRDQNGDRDPNAPRTDAEQPHQPRHDQDTPEQQRPRDRENEANSTPDSNRDRDAENGDGRLDDDRTDEERANSELYHQRLARQAVSELERGEPEDYDTVRQETEAKARQIEISYTRKLKPGIKLRVYFESPNMDIRNNKLDFKVIIAPNDTEVPGERDISNLDAAKEEVRKAISQSRTTEEVEKYFSDIIKEFKLDELEWDKLGTELVNIKLRISSIGDDYRDLAAFNRLILQSTSDSRDHILLKHNVDYEPGEIETPTGDYLPVGKRMSAIIDPKVEASHGTSRLRNVMQYFITLPKVAANRNIRARGPSSSLEPFSEDYSVPATSQYIAGHLLNSYLGGPNAAKNLYPITQQANSEHYHRVEKTIIDIWQGTNNKYWVKYEVVVEQKSIDIGRPPYPPVMTVDADFNCEASVLAATGQEAESISPIDDTIESRYISGIMNP